MPMAGAGGAANSLSDGGCTPQSEGFFGNRRLTLKQGPHVIIRVRVGQCRDSGIKINVEP